MYKKRAKVIEYEMHKFVFDHGINTSQVISWDGKELTTKAIPNAHCLSNHPANVSTSVTMAIKLVREVEKLHKLGYLHGDLNPTNVMISGEDVYLIDFEMTEPIDSSFITHKMEMVDLMRLLVIILSVDLQKVSKLLSLCKEKQSSRLSYGLKSWVGYEDIIQAIES